MQFIINKKRIIKVTLWLIKLEFSPIYKFQSFKMIWSSSFQKNILWAKCCTKGPNNRVNILKFRPKFQFIKKLIFSKYLPFDRPLNFVISAWNSIFWCSRFKFISTNRISAKTISAALFDHIPIKYKIKKFQLFEKIIFRKAAFGKFFDHLHRFSITFFLRILHFFCFRNKIWN